MDSIVVLVRYLVLITLLRRRDNQRISPVVRRLSRTWHFYRKLSTLCPPPSSAILLHITFEISLEVLYRNFTQFYDQHHSISLGQLAAEADLQIRGVQLETDL